MKLTHPIITNAHIMTNNQQKDFFLLFCWVGVVALVGGGNSGFSSVVIILDGNTPAAISGYPAGQDRGPRVLLGLRIFIFHALWGTATGGKVPPYQYG